MVSSPNHEGVEGTDWEEVWMLTGEYAILVMGPPYCKGVCFLPSLRRHIFTLARYFLAARCAIRGPHKLQDLLTEDEQAQRSTPAIIQHRRPGPRNPADGRPASAEPTVLHRGLEKKASLRKVADDCGVSQETIRRAVRAAGCGSKASLSTDLPRSQHSG